MRLSYTNSKTQAEVYLITGEAEFTRTVRKRSADKLYTLAWNQGATRTVIIDEVEHGFPANSILSLMINDSFRFPDLADIVVWQFNREFYCIADHDKEVGCLGILFYGSSGQMFIDLDQEHQDKIESLMRVFVDEFNTVDNIQNDMLQMLLKRLIIILTRLVKGKYACVPDWTDAKMDIVRQYNVLVEQYYKKHHDVQFYAGKLNKSPKTLANHFVIYNSKSPIAVIHDRIISEAKRLLIYTDKTGKEIAYALGFDDAAYFSKFFKRHTTMSLQAFRQSKQTPQGQ